MNQTGEKKNSHKVKKLGKKTEGNRHGCPERCRKAFWGSIINEHR